jgi:hypothetical protein
MGFLCKLVSVIGILQRSFRVPVCDNVAFLVMFGGSMMGLRRKLVLLGGSPVCLVHGVPSRGKVGHPYMCTRPDQLRIAPESRSGGQISSANFALAKANPAPSRLSVAILYKNSQPAAPKTFVVKDEVGAARAHRLRAAHGKLKCLVESRPESDPGCTC